MLKPLIERITGADLSVASAEARSIIRRRLLARQPTDLGTLVDQSHIEPQHRDSAVELLETLGKVLSVPATSFRADENMGEVVRVSWSDLSLKSQDALRRHGAFDPLEEFNYDLFAEIERRADPYEWDKQRRGLSDPPVSEQQWLDRIVKMSLAEFLQFFSPTMRRRL